MLLKNSEFDKLIYLFLTHSGNILKNILPNSQQGFDLMAEKIIMNLYCHSYSGFTKKYY